MNSRLLGVYGETGDPIPGSAMQPSPMNVIEAVGRFPRIFDEVMTLQGETEREYVLGSPQAGKLTWYVINDMIEKARPYPINLKFLSFKGTGAVQASKSILDTGTSPANTLSLKDAYRDKVSSGVWGNDSGFRVDHGTISQTTISGTTLANATTLPLTSVVGVKKGSILRITHAASDFGFKVLSINENDKTVSGIADAALPALAANDVVKIVGFKITAVRRDYRGKISKQPIGLNDSWLSMESESEDYIVTVFKNHPLFKAVDESSTALFWKKFPAPTAAGTYLFLDSGSDGTAPASTSDWTNLQASFPSKNTFAILNAESSSKAVHQSYIDFAAGRKDHPVYVAPIQDFGTDFVSLRDWALDFVQRDGWVQFGEFYGWRYVSDPVGDGSDPVKLIPVCGGVLGNWIKVIYSGFVHRAPAEERFFMSGYLDGPAARPEDSWTDQIRTDLYNAGVNIVNKKEGVRGVLLRNFRSPSEDYLVRDLHIHAINQLIKFTSELNLRRTENTPNKFALLQRDARRIDEEVLKPMFEGSFAPFCIDQETGAFRSEDDDGKKLNWYDVAGTRADRFNNPPAQFAQGDADLWPEWIPYSLRKSLRIKVSTAVQIFTNRGQ
ncbi:hypothetical protein [Leptospira andrefontaineae]|uniref:Phage tail protein n=1 Tax=Leptospira andrefontaineae TaxID=2484976 RepID=A0A4R9GYN5_9LEPT|nr:hypothetical protein [Leptospira andrefontaineae]TGK36283.1 hypothetical protein EHO65_18455 [Leptospira andrefontaineae]